MANSSVDLWHVHGRAESIIQASVSNLSHTLRSCVYMKNTFAKMDASSLQSRFLTLHEECRQTVSMTNHYA